MSQLPEGFDSTLAVEEVDSFHNGAPLRDIPGIDELPTVVSSQDGEAAALVCDIDM